MAAHASATLLLAFSALVYAAAGAVQDPFVLLGAGGTGGYAGLNDTIVWTAAAALPSGACGPGPALILLGDDAHGAVLTGPTPALRGVRCWPQALNLNLNPKYTPLNPKYTPLNPKYPAKPSTPRR